MKHPKSPNSPSPASSAINNSVEIELGSSQHEARVREKLYYLVSIVSLAHEPDLH